MATTRERKKLGSAINGGRKATATLRSAPHVKTVFTCIIKNLKNKFTSNIEDRRER